MTESQEYEIKLRDAFSGKLGDIERKMDHFENRLGRTGNLIEAVFGGNLVTQAFNKTIDLISEATTQTIKLGMEMERTQIKFGVMLGRGELFAHTMIKAFQSFALDTPFSTKEVMQGATLLTAYQFSADKLIPTMRMLGDVTSALNLRFEDMAWLYGTTKTEGFAFAKDIRQFQLRGISLIPQLAKQMGIAQDQVLEYAKKRKITFEEIEKAFIAMTSKGGIYHNVMDSIAKSTSGRWERFKDKLEVMMTNLGMSWLPQMNRFLDLGFVALERVGEIDWKKWFQPVDDAVNFFEEIYNRLNAIVPLVQVFGVTLRIALLPLEVALTVMRTTMAGILYVFDKLQSLKFKHVAGIGWLPISATQNGEETAEQKFSKAMEKISATWTGSRNYGNTPSYGAMTGPMPFAPQPPTLFGPSGKKPRGASDDGYEGAGLSKIASSTRNIHINIQTLVGTIEFTKSYEQSEARLQEMIKRALVAVVNDVNIVTG